MSQVGIVEQLGWTKLPISKLTTTIRNLAGLADTTYVYREGAVTALLNELMRRDGVRLETYQSSMEFEPWQRGRIFQAQYELKWERIGTCFHVVYCGQQLPASFQPVQWAAVGRQSVPYYLWGQRVTADDRQLLDLKPDEPAFVELQIPRILFYPVSEQAWRVRLNVYEFYDQSGQIWYGRWYGLQEEREQSV